MVSEFDIIVLGRRHPIKLDQYPLPCRGKANHFAVVDLRWYFRFGAVNERSHYCFKYKFG